MFFALLLAACGPTRIEADPVDTGGDSGCAPVAWWPDADADGWGGGEETVDACEAPTGFVAQSGDCDDQDAGVHPGAVESCNGVDDDCDGASDNAEATWYTDGDGDGYGDPSTGVQTCQPSETQVEDGTDCDDQDAATNPAAEETCGDHDDDDCDGLVDVGAASEWHTDDDGDGFGHMYDYETTCEPDPSWVLDGTDCRPNDAEAFPGATERCNDDDDNCDRVADEGMDADGDGHRNALCDDGDDCDDTDPDAWPGNPVDTCEDGVDGDCDGVDQPCGFWGGYAASGGDAYTYSDDPDYDAGRLVDVGDATGDGIGDLLVATLYADSYGGGGYLLPGPVNGTDTYDNVGFRMYGRSSATYGSGRSIGIGDVDGDGVEDLGFGAPYGNNAGMYVELGPITGDRDLTSPDVELSCLTSTYCGHGGDIGDVSGDGVADAIVGAYADGSGGPYSGTTFIVHGPLADDVYINDEADVIIEGEGANYYTARHVYAGGDYDGDGLTDLMVAAPYGTGAGGPYSGVVYVLLAPVTATDMSMADARLLGPAANGYLGNGAAMGSGDIDGDGDDDVAAGSYTSSGGGHDGAAYVVYSPPSGDIDLSGADITVEGVGANDYAGASVAMGDINGDGLCELLVGAAGDSTGAMTGGAGYLFLTPAAGSWTTADADAWFLGDSASASAGTSAVLDDLNGDGADDVILGAPEDATGAAGGGATYVFYSSR